MSFTCLGILVVVAGLGVGLFQTQRDSYSLPLGNVFRPAGFSLADMPSLNGKSAIVTGANSGVGYVTARELARQGCRVVLACRSETRGQQAVAKMVAEGIDRSLLEVVPLDLASLASVRTFVSSAPEVVHILVLNAGLNAAVFETTEDGFELSFQANHLSHFLLTRLLLPKLRAAQSARVVVLSSDSHFDTYEPEGVLLPKGPETDLGAGINNQSRFHPLKAYGQAKLCNALFAKELARRLASPEDSGTHHIRVNVAHPGLTHSGFYATIAQRLDDGGSTVAARAVRVFDRYLAPLIAYSSETAALTPLYLAAAPAVESQDVRGRYFVPVATEMPDSAHAQDRKLQQRLWDLSEQLVSA